MLATAKVREVLAVLINFLAYYESADYILAETESEVLALKQKKIQSEKQLNEKRKHLEKLKQVMPLPLSHMKKSH